ncbi:MAG: hypothetical protein ACYTAF_12895, partial [Planctomycetota bacterium]
IGRALEDLKKAKDGEDIEAIKRGMEELSKASHEFSRLMYEEAAKKQQGAQAGPGPGAGAPPPPPPAGEPAGKKGGKDDDNIIDAEYEAK